MRYRVHWLRTGQLSLVCIYIPTSSRNVQRETVTFAPQWSSPLCTGSQYIWMRFYLSNHNGIWMPFFVLQSSLSCKCNTSRDSHFLSLTHRLFGEVKCTGEFSAYPYILLIANFVNLLSTIITLTRFIWEVIEPTMNVGYTSILAGTLPPLPWQFGFCGDAETQGKDASLCQDLSHTSSDRDRSPINDAVGGVF